VLSVDDELAVLGLDGSLEAAMGGVILEHVCLQTWFNPRSIQVLKQIYGPCKPNQ
jgi:hypothetical protein